jgi:hypothetical protein
MKGNKITEWSWDVPTEPGFYMCCNGDVETVANTELVEFLEGDFYEGGLDVHYDYYKSSCKWARLLIGSDAK